MAVTQYIGSRYVPLFADPIDWDITRAYEPLTIVYYQGNSYTSKQSVPTGIDVTNTTYWAITGNYNAQIEQYRREVQAFDGRITANAQAIADEVTARMAEDTAIRGLISDLQDDLTAEESARETADTQIRTDFAAADAQIRTDFAAADTQIRTDFAAADTDLGARIDKITSNSYVGLYGAKENDGSIDWQAVINQVAAVSDTISFGSGKWIINSPINIPANITCICGNGAQITANSSVETLFTILRDNTFARISGFVFNCNRNVGTVIKTVNSNKCSVFDCDFYNWINYAIDTDDQIGCLISNCQFDNDIQNSQYPNTTAIITSTDSIISGCKFFRTPHCILLGSNSSVSNCYFWGVSDTNRQLHCIESHIETRTVANISVTECEFDCAVYAFTNLTRAIITGNHFYWNTNDDTYNGEHAIFNYTNDSDTFLNGVVFDNNTFAASGVSGKVNTFKHSGNHSIYGGYSSKSNIVDIPTNERSNFALSVGSSNNVDADFTENNIGFHFVPVFNHSTQYNTVYKLKLALGEAMIERRGTQCRNFSMLKALPTPFMNGLHWTYNNNNVNSDFYVQGYDYRQFKEIEFGNNEVYNMELEASTIPTTSGYTKIGVTAAIS